MTEIPEDLKRRAQAARERAMADHRPAEQAAVANVFRQMTTFAGIDPQQIEEFIKRQEAELADKIRTAFAPPVVNRGRTGEGELAVEQVITAVARVLYIRQQEHSANFPPQYTGWDDDMDYAYGELLVALDNWKNS